VPNESQLAAKIEKSASSRAILRCFKAKAFRETDGCRVSVSKPLVSS